MSQPPAAPDATLSGQRPTLDGAMRLLRSHGGRASTVRRAVLEALIAAAGEHRTAEQLAAEVHARHPDVHQSSVYRTLERFEDLGLVYHVHLGHGPSQWHLAHDRRLYLTCSGCGHVFGADPGVFEDFKAQLSARFDFHVDFGHFAISGLCSSCRRS